MVLQTSHIRCSTPKNSLHHPTLWLVRQVNELRLRLAPPRHTQVRPHAPFFALLLPQNLTRDTSSRAFLSDALRRLREADGVENVVRGVDDVFGEGDALGKILARLNGILKGGGVGDIAFEEECDGLQVVGFDFYFLSGAVAIVRV